jgi:hypothetical protein
VVVAALAAVLVTGACSEEHAGTLPTPSPSVPSATGTPSASLSALGYDGELRRAITTYYAALNAAVHDPAANVEALGRLIAPSCECRKVLDALREEAHEGRYVDYSYSIRDLRVIAVGDRGGNAAFVVVQSPGHERGHDGTVLHAFRGSTQSYSVHFVRTATGAWLLDRASRAA